MEVLPDILQAGLKVIFCGTAVGARSAHEGDYYAGLGNRFWEVLYRIGLTPRKLDPLEWRVLPNYGIGLTDLVKDCSGGDARISFREQDMQSFRSKVEQFAPKAIAFNGKRAAREFYGHRVQYGRQPQRIRQTEVFVLPSTSAAGRKYWCESYWEELADSVGKHW